MLITQSYNQPAKLSLGLKLKLNNNFITAVAGAGVSRANKAWVERTEVSNFYRSFIQFAGQLIIKLQPAGTVRKLLPSRYTTYTLKMLKTNHKNWTFNLKYHDCLWSMKWN